MIAKLFFYSLNWSNFFCNYRNDLKARPYLVYRVCWKYCPIESLRFFQDPIIMLSFQKCTFLAWKNPDCSKIIDQTSTCVLLESKVTTLPLSSDWRAWLQKISSISSGNIFRTPDPLACYASKTVEVIFRRKASSTKIILSLHWYVRRCVRKQ